MTLNLGTILSANAEDRPDQSAVIHDQRKISYADLDRAARSIALALHERGVQPGDTVAVLIPNVPEFTLAYFGILYAGAVVVPINVLAAAPEVSYFLEDSKARILIAHALFEDAAREGSGAVGVSCLMAGTGGGEGSFEEMQEGPPRDGLHPTAAEDTAVILYTSGTTGKPKGAELTHANLLLNCAFVVPRLIEGYGPGSVALASLPLFHSFGQTVIQNGALAAGATFTLLPRFEPGLALEVMERDCVTVFAGVPTMYFSLLHHEAERVHDLSSLEVCMTGGAPMPVEVMNAFEEKFSVEIHEGFGLSETSPIASFGMRGRPRKAGSIGYPVWGVEMQIVDEGDKSLPDNERGEICIRGHNIMKGYLGRPDATKEALKGGWFHSGDIGYRDEDGCYWIVDRKKDMILRGGFNVYPREVEEVLYAHPAVVEAAVIGVPHESHGEEVKAVVALGAGQEVSEDAIIAFCKERLAAYKYPRSVEFLPDLPKGPTGKLLKRELR